MFRQGTVFRHAALLTALAAVGACSQASAAPPPKDLWATVNICDTVAHPDQMGVRASMPGNGTRERMWMRFHAQFYNSQSKKWFDVKGGVSGWQAVGSARVKVQQAGFTFMFNPPDPGQPAYVLRGVVDFQWRAKRRTRSGHLRTVIVRTLHANTKGDHPADGADPAGYSSGICEIR
jgi:hypothetical protein